MTSPMRLLSAMASGWDRFFFDRRDLRTCAAIRIAYAVLVLIWLAVVWPDLAKWYAADGVLPPHAAERLAPAGSWSLLYFLPPGGEWLGGVWLLATVHATLLLVGFGSRINAAAVFVWIVSFCHRNEVILDSEDIVFRLVGFLLVLMPCGACWSVDAWLCRRSNANAHPDGESAAGPASCGPAWGLRLLQIQMCVIFFSAGWCKLLSPAWQDGTAMFYVARLTDYFGRLPTPDILWNTPWIVRLITWSVIAVELAIPLLIWWKPARLWALAAVLVFHLANEYAMHLFLFHWIMLVGWSSFLNGDDLNAAASVFHMPQRK